MNTPIKAFECRLAVEFGSAADDAAARWSNWLTRVPTDRVSTVEHLGLEYREDFPIFLAVWCIAFGAMGALGHSINSLVPAASLAATTLALVMDCTAVLCGVRAFLAATRRVRICARPNALVLERAIGKLVRTDRIAADEITAIIIAGRTGRRRIVAVGARNVPLVEVFAERFMDPPSVLPWMAEAVTRLAVCACARKVDGADGREGRPQHEESPNAASTHMGVARIRT